jgi:hypothetical protein
MILLHTIDMAEYLGKVLKNILYVSIIIEFNMALRTADHAREWCEIRGDLATLVQKNCDNFILKD